MGESDSFDHPHLERHREYQAQQASLLLGFTFKWTSNIFIFSRIHAAQAHAAHDHILHSLAVESALYVSINTNMPIAAIVLRCVNTIIRVCISLKIYSWTSIAVITTVAPRQSPL